MQTDPVENKNRSATQLACDQGGVITREQLINLGLSPSLIERKARQGEWKRLHRAVYEIMEMKGLSARLFAAVVILPTAVISHESAAEIHGFEFDELRSGLVVVSVVTETTHDHEGVIVHRNSDIEDHHFDTVEGLPVTSRTRTAFDLVAQMKPRQAVALLDHLLIRKLISVPGMRELLNEIGRSGKPGSKVCRAYLEKMEGSRGGSPLHRLAIDLLEESNLPMPEEEFPIPWASGRRFDLAFEDAKLAIELDGYAYHSSPERFQSDRERDRQAHLNGWHILRFTWRDLAARPAEFIGHIEQHLLRSGAEASSKPS